MGVVTRAGDTPFLFSFLWARFAFTSAKRGESLSSEETGASERNVYLLRGTAPVVCLDVATPPSGMRESRESRYFLLIAHLPPGEQLETLPVPIPRVIPELQPKGVTSPSARNGKICAYWYRLPPSFVLLF